MYDLDREVSQTDFEKTVFVNRLTSKILNEKRVSKKPAPPPITKNPFESPAASSSVGSNPFEGDFSPADSVSSSALAAHFFTDLPLDPDLLRENFEKTIEELQHLQREYEQQAALLKQETIMAQRKHHNRCQEAFEDLIDVEKTFQEMDVRIRHVGSKVVQLSEKLSGEDKPRHRIIDAIDVIADFYLFYNGVQFLWTVDRDSMLQAAVRVHKLALLCLELPDDEDFQLAKRRINDANQQLDNDLLQDFIGSYARGDLSGMRIVVEVFRYSKNFKLCIEAFVSKYLENVFSQDDLRERILKLAEGTEPAVNEVFAPSDMVTNKLIVELFSKNMKHHLDKQLDPRLRSVDAQLEDYLESLYKNYVKMKSLCETVHDLCSKGVSQMDYGLLMKQVQDLYRPYLKDYASYECRWLNDRFGLLHQQFYDSMKVTKREFNKSSLSELRREMGQLFNIRQELNPVESSQVLLSHNVAINMIDAARTGARRCKELSDPDFVGSNAKAILDVLMNHLIKDHLQYGLDVALLTVNAVSGRQEPNLLFLEATNVANSILHLFDSTVSDAICPMLGPALMNRFLEEKAYLSQQLEHRINLGMEQCLQACVQFIHTTLRNEQKLQDFKSDTHSLTEGRTQACNKVCQFVQIVKAAFQSNLDGRNVTLIMHEFGLRFHRVLLDHFYSFQYSSNGGYIAMMDVTAYKEVILEKNPDPSLAHLFHLLNKLMNVLAMKAENLKQIYMDYSEEDNISKDVFMTFVKLRVDFRSENLNNVLK